MRVPCLGQGELPTVLVEAKALRQDQSSDSKRQRILTEPRRPHVGRKSGIIITISPKAVLMG